MKTVGIRELKIHLSAHLRDVARGDVVLVTDRSRVVAELRPPATGTRASMTPDAAVRERLVECGLLRPSARPGRQRWESALPRLLKSGTVQELLDADRKERSA